MRWTNAKSRGRFGLLLLGVALLGGCASLRKPVPMPDQELPPATPEQQAWFEANRDRAHYVPNRGYAVEGADGYYNDQGQPLKSDPSKFITVKESDDPGASVWKKLEPAEVSKGFMKMVGKGPNEQVAKAAYAEGDELFRQAKYAQAAKKFKEAYKRGPDLALEEDAMFKSGECYFFSDQYAKSDDGYGQLVKKYSNSPYLDRVAARRFAIARYWEQVDMAKHHWMLTPNLTDKTRPLFDTRGHALRVYDRVHIDNPSGPLADDAVMAAGNNHFRNARYEDADYSYTLLRNNFAKSEHQYQAHLLGFQAKLRRYQGPQYDTKPLDEADEIAAQLLAQFSRELGDEHDRIVEARAWIRASKAQREFEIASYYHKNKYYAASKLYYDEVIRAYPDTKLAAESRAKIEEVKDLPPAPPKPFAWLDKVIAPAGNGLGTTGLATSGLPAGMPATPAGVGTLGGAGAGMPAMGPGSYGGGT